MIPITYSPGEEGTRSEEFDHFVFPAYPPFCVSYLSGIMNEWLINDHREGSVIRLNGFNSTEHPDQGWSPTTHGCDAGPAAGGLPRSATEKGLPALPGRHANQKVACPGITKRKYMGLSPFLRILLAFPSLLPKQN